MTIYQQLINIIYFDFIINVLVRYSQQNQKNKNLNNISKLLNNLKKKC
jgi:hypothetical protein